MSAYICPNCEYVYDEEQGDPREGWPAGTPFTAIDPDWTCPDCGVREQVDFVPVEEFEHNDQDGNIISMETRRQQGGEQAGQGSRALGGEQAGQGSRALGGKQAQQAEQEAQQ